MKTTLALLALFVIILGGGYLLKGRPMHADMADDMGSVSAAAVAGTGDAAYTSAQVATHSTSGNCWASIDGTVYDLTGWVSQHPGGEARILSICGTDATQAFEQQHGAPQDTEPKRILATFKVGTLAN